MSLSLEKFSGKVAVVTGASSGIGKAIAEGLVKYGMRVAGIARRVKRLQEHAQQLKGQKGALFAFEADLNNTDEILTTFVKITKELGPIHVLVNNAGLRLGTNIIDGHIDQWKVMLDTNVLALAICTREAIKSMKEHNIKGQIINVNSVVGHQIVNYPRSSIYQASKHAVTALTETVRLEINREKLPIKITSISPGAVRTEFREIAEGKKVAEELHKRPALEAEDVAQAAFYVLATPEHVNVKELTVKALGEE